MTEGADKESGIGVPTSHRDEQQPVLSIDIVTLFPPLFNCWLDQGVVSRAMARGLVSVALIDLRSHGIGRHQITDDYPFGGGPGMVLKPEPLFEAIESLSVDAATPVILMSPRGRQFDHMMAQELAHLSRFILVAGHYEGVDERVREHLATDEISIGNYVLSSGEIAAMVVSDAVVRLVPGALASGSAVEESYSSGLLEYPQYTRPATFRDWKVPEVLLSGNHGEIARWKREQALWTTLVRRPDLLDAADLSETDRELLRHLRVSADGSNSRGERHG